ncbi:TonB-dependent receptor [Horticoccus luteus]|uniref:TonB-dependent receptor n=1 Tax=Horticoccus luteus TaxID=2862869 RepID=A0A8F9TWQ7_9BACT|nr:TonB-dependent receptor [Horticoccus luteus]QYM79452.1 TonB-dependent receptor [Horticoccus luteus]
MNKLRSRKFVATLSLFATSGLFAVSGYAQTTADNSKQDEPQVLEKFEVTGSYLPPAANSVAIPVISVTSQVIANSGNTTNVLEILRKTVPQFSGNGNLGSTNSNVGSGRTNGGSMVSLRNTATLVLINGRRVAYSPVSSSGGYQFVDVNMIPVAAIERIEVLADGASAIYGSDAVAGVVNIILKTDFEGFEIGGRYGWATSKGHQAERSAYLVGGVSNGKTSITITSEWTKIDPIMAYERPYSAVTYGTPSFAGSVNIGGNFYLLDPAKTAPTVTPGGLSPAALVAAGTYSGPRSQGDQFEFFNLSQYVTQTIKNERQSFSMAMDHKVNDNIKLFGDLLYVNTKTYSQINGQPLNTTQAMKDIYAQTNGAQGSANGLVPAGQFGNPFNVGVTGRNRLVAYPRAYADDTTSIRGVLGLKGEIGDTGWSWEIAADYNRANQQYQNPGVINQPNLSAATLDGVFNFFSRDPISPADMANYQVTGTAQGGFISLLSNYDAKVRGKLFELPGGSVDIAIGAELRKENLSATADPLSQINPVTGALGWSGATTLYPFDSGRKVTSTFAEVRVPIAKDVPGAHLLEASVAVRHESYSDTTDPTVPKYSLRYLPVNDEFAIRATYSKSFSAPQLYSLFGPASIGYTDPFTLDKAGGGSVANLQTNIMSGSNPNLKPSNSKNYTFGVVYSPKALKGFSVSVDYWDIKQTDLVSSIGSATILQDVETNGTASPYVDKVHFLSFTGANPTAAGQISSTAPDDIYVIDSLVNITGQHLSGVDIKANYTYNADNVGIFDFSSNLGYYRKYEITALPGSAPENDVGWASFAQGTIPHWLAYTTAEYRRGDYTAFIGWRYIGGVTNIVTEEKIPSVSTFDVSASYTFGSSVKYLAGAKLTVGANNVFNKFGPAAPDIFTDANVDIATYDPMGRFIYVDLKFKF